MVRACRQLPTNTVCIHPLACTIHTQQQGHMRDEIEQLLVAWLLSYCKLLDL
jgi:hypothetical protein